VPPDCRVSRILARKATSETLQSPQIAESRPGDCDIVALLEGGVPFEGGVTDNFRDVRRGLCDDEVNYRDIVR